MPENEMKRYRSDKQSIHRPTNTYISNKLKHKVTINTTFDVAFKTNW